MSASNNLTKKGTILTLGEDELLAEMVSSCPCLYGKTWKEYKEQQNKSLKRKKETIVLWPIILFKHSMPSPGMKYISSAVHITCAIIKWLNFEPN